MDENRYLLKHTDEIITPCLIYYKDIIEQNIKEMISVAGNANRLWPHVKSHKMKKLVELQIKMGITRFKCATIAEAQMVAESGASDALVAYPLVGPNIDRFLELVKTYAGTRFWAIGDDLEQVSLLNSAAGSQETMSPPAFLQTSGVLRLGDGANLQAMRLLPVPVCIGGSDPYMQLGNP